MIKCRSNKYIPYLKLRQHTNRTAWMEFFFKKQPMLVFGRRLACSLVLLRLWLSTMHLTRVHKILIEPRCRSETYIYIYTSTYVPTLEPNPPKRTYRYFRPIGKCWFLLEFFRSIWKTTTSDIAIMDHRHTATNGVTFRQYECCDTTSNYHPFTSSQQEVCIFFWYIFFFLEFNYIFFLIFTCWSSFSFFLFRVSIISF